MRNRPMTDEQRARVTVGVLQRIHLALASIEARRLEGGHEGWTSHEAMNADYQALLGMKEMVCNGEDLTTTQHSRLFIMRELVLVGANFILPDADYILSEKAAWFTCGPMSIRLREANDGKSLICAMYPRGKEDQDSLAQCEALYEDARAEIDTVPA